MYEYKGYVVMKDTGASMPFKFNCDDYSMAKNDMDKILITVLGAQIENIKYIQEYKVTKR